ncbi:MAG: phosphate acyltransferase PlsX [Bacilli bacterium]|nr:phosphate acyltransferase PlsX [Bacilli bacterium]
MARLIIDAMGGDNGSKAVVEAVLNYLEKKPETNFTVVGKKEELTALEGKCEIVDARDIVPMEAGALEAMRMKDSSMYKALALYKEGGYDGIASCGSTGAFLSLATLILKTIPGIKRAALVAPFPTKEKGKYVIVLDAGASNENSPEEMAQFAVMGRYYYQVVYDKDEPNIYLLSNGSEEHKGSPNGQAAFKLIKEMNLPGFKGNLEARYVCSGDADVVVADGYTGNIFVKSSEGMAKIVGSMIKSTFKKNFLTKLGYLFVRKGMKEMTATMDYRSTGGALFLGINGNVMKIHGNADAYCFESGITCLDKLVSGNVVNKIKESLKNE